jgi:hypothetical protein
VRVVISRDKLEGYYIQKRLSSRKIAKIYGCAYSTVDRKIRQFGFKVRTLADAHVLYPRTDFSGDLNEKAYILGFAIGDLRVRKVYKNSETIHVDCASTKVEQIDLIKGLFDKYGRVWIGKLNKKGAVQIECFLNDSFDFLLNTNKDIIEPWIKNNKYYFANFLAGFTDAEGSFYISRNKAFYALGNYNIQLLMQIKDNLKRFGIESPKISCSVRNGTIASHGYAYNNDYWSLVISKKKELVKLFTFIEPYLKHASRKKNMVLARQNIERRNKLYGE